MAFTSDSHQFNVPMFMSKDKTPLPTTTQHQLHLTKDRKVQPQQTQHTKLNRYGGALARKFWITKPLLQAQGYYQGKK